MKYTQRNENKLFYNYVLDDSKIVSYSNKFSGLENWQQYTKEGIVKDSEIHQKLMALMKSQHNLLKD